MMFYQRDKNKELGLLLGLMDGGSLERRILRLMDRRAPWAQRWRVASVAACVGAMGLLSVPLGLLGARASVAQTVAAKESLIEAASIRPAECSGLHFPNMAAGSLLQMGSNSLKMLIVLAYGVSDDRIVDMPGWADSDCFAIEARLKAGYETSIEDRKGASAFIFKGVKAPLQQLLEERFKLAVEHGMKEVPGFALVVAPSGAKMVEATDFTSHSHSSMGEIHNPSLSMKPLTEALQVAAGAPVVDRTGLTGIYRIDLSFAPQEATESTLPSIFTAVHEQLGLRLVATKVPVETLTIRHLDRTPIEN